MPPRRKAVQGGGPSPMQGLIDQVRAQLDSDSATARMVCAADGFVAHVQSAMQAAAECADVLYDTTLNGVWKWVAEAELSLQSHGPGARDRPEPAVLLAALLSKATEVASSTRDQPDARQLERCPTHMGEGRSVGDELRSTYAEPSSSAAIDDPEDAQMSDAEMSTLLKALLPGGDADDVERAARALANQVEPNDGDGSPFSYRWLDLAACVPREAATGAGAEGFVALMQILQKLHEQEKHAITLSTRVKPGTRLHCHIAAIAGENGFSVDGAAWSFCPRPTWTFGPPDKRAAVESQAGEAFRGDRLPNGEDRRFFLIVGTAGMLTETHLDAGVQTVVYHTVAGANHALGVPTSLAALLHGVSTTLRAPHAPWRCKLECDALGLCGDARTLSSGTFLAGDTMIILPGGGHAILTGERGKVVVAGEWHLSPPPPTGVEVVEGTVPSGRDVSGAPPAPAGAASGVASSGVGGEAETDAVRRVTPTVVHGVLFSPVDIATANQVWDKIAQKFRCASGTKAPSEVFLIGCSKQPPEPPESDRRVPRAITTELEAARIQLKALFDPADVVSGGDGSGWLWFACRSAVSPSGESTLLQQRQDRYTVMKAKLKQVGLVELSTATVLLGGTGGTLDDAKAAFPEDPATWCAHERHAATTRASVARKGANQWNEEATARFVTTTVSVLELEHSHYSITKRKPQDARTFSGKKQAVGSGTTPQNASTPLLTLPPPLNFSSESRDVLTAAVIATPALAKVLQQVVAHQQQLQSAGVGFYERITTQGDAAGSTTPYYTSRALHGARNGKRTPVQENFEAALGLSRALVLAVSGAAQKQTRLLRPCDSSAASSDASRGPLQLLLYSASPSTPPFANDCWTVDATGPFIAAAARYFMRDAVVDTTVWADVLSRWRIVDAKAIVSDAQVAVIKGFLFPGGNGGQSDLDRERVVEAAARLNFLVLALEADDVCELLRVNAAAGAADGKGWSSEVSEKSVVDDQTTSLSLLTDVVVDAKASTLCILLSFQTSNGGALIACSQSACTIATLPKGYPAPVETLDMERLARRPGHATVKAHITAERVMVVLRGMVSGQVVDVLLMGCNTAPIVAALRALFMRTRKDFSDDACANINIFYTNEVVPSEFALHATQVYLEKQHRRGKRADMLDDMRCRLDVVQQQHKIDCTHDPVVALWSERLRHTTLADET